MSFFKSATSDLDAAYRDYSDIVYRVALGQLGSKEDAEDCVQETFYRFLQRPFGFSSPEHEKAWLLRVAINLSRDIMRKNKTRDHDILTDIPYCQNNEESLSLFQSLDALPEKVKGAVILHYLEGFSIEETAKILHITTSAVKMRLKRGREALKNIIESGDENV